MSLPMEESIEMITTVKYLRELTSDKTNYKSILISGHNVEIDLDDPDEHFIQKAKEELRETPEIVAEAFKQLKELLAGEPNLYIPKSDDFLIKFLRPVKWYPESAFRLIKRHYRFYQTYPHIFINLIPSKDNIPICSNLIYPLPLRNKEGSRTLLLEAGKKWKPKIVPFDMYFRSLLLLMIIASTEYKTQIGGIRIIIDAEGFPLTHVTYLTPSYAKMALDFIQKCLPLRLKSIHIINQSIFFNLAFAIFKPFIEEKFRKRIFFHGTDRESLMAHIDKETLFKKYGGELDSLDESFGTNFLHNISNYSNLYEVITSFGYKTEDKKK